MKRLKGAVTRRARRIIALTVCACATLLDIGPLDVQERIVADASPEHESPPDDGSPGSTDRDEPDAPDAPPKNLARPALGEFTFVATAGSGSIGNERLTDYAYGPIAYGSTAAVTVAAIAGTDDCVTIAFRFRIGYEETLTMCVRGAELVQEKLVRNQQFPFALIKVDVTCAPGDTYFVEAPSPSQSWPHACSGTMNDTTTNGGKFTTASTYAFVGEEDVTTTPPTKTLHFTETRLIEGAQRGTYNVDFYFAPDGQLVRFKRTIDIKYDSSTLIQEINYVEQEDMKLKKEN